MSDHWPSNICEFVLFKVNTYIFSSRGDARALLQETEKLFMSEKYIS